MISGPKPFPCTTVKTKAKHRMPVCVLPARMCFDRGLLSLVRSLQSLAKILPRFSFLFFVPLWCSRRRPSIECLCVFCLLACAFVALAETTAATLCRNDWSESLNSLTFYFPGLHGPLAHESQKSNIKRNLSLSESDRLRFPLNI